MTKKAGTKIHSLGYVLSFFVGILIFTGLLQAKSPWYYLSFIGVLISVAVIVNEIRTVNDFVVLLGLKRFSGNAWYFFCVSILFGVFWGIIFRDYLDIRLLPVKIIWFALPAMAIGSVEELIFRGYIQQKLRNVGTVVSIVGGSAMHTFYKCFIFIVLPPIHPTDFFWLSIWTFCIGCVLGVLKEYSANTQVPIAGHATFDLIVYGDGMVDSWWVWL